MLEIPLLCLKSTSAKAHHYLKTNFTLKCRPATLPNSAAHSKCDPCEKSRLDVASRRLQVELDALGLVHKLRTQEEFTRLAGLWKRIANVRNYYGTIAQVGLRLTSADKEEQKRYDTQVADAFVHPSTETENGTSLLSVWPLADCA